MGRRKVKSNNEVKDGVVQNETKLDAGDMKEDIFSNQELETSMFNQDNNQRSDMNIEFEFKMINIDNIKPNSWNVNEMKSETFNRLVEEIREVGFIEPIQVVEDKSNLGNYTIIGGEHRYYACKYLGYKEIPCIILKSGKFDDIDLQKFVSIRLNILRGKINPEKFVKLYDEMADKYGAEALQKLMGFTDTEEYMKLVKAIGRSVKDLGLGDKATKEFEKKAKNLKDVDQLADLLNDIFSKYGNTLEYDFMVFNYGGKNIYWVKLDRKVKKVMDDIIERCLGNKETINRYLYKIFEHYYSLNFEDEIKEDNSN
jgi:ParB/RepB/Spo0J family partition protein